MISSNCIPIIRAELNKLGHHYFSLTMGELELAGNLTSSELLALKKALSILGYSLLNDQDSKLISDVKKILAVEILFSVKNADTSYRKQVSKKAGKDYELINALFIEVMGVTIERYALLLKIEKAKELLVYQNLPISTVAMNAGFYNTANLVNHFKRNIGITPNQFKIAKREKHHLKK